MGVLFSKPLTREDLNTALNMALNTALNTALTPIRNDIADLKGDMALMKDSLLAPEGDQTAKKVTVAVYSIGSSPTCHGCLMSRGDRVYLVSAAHAIVDLTHEGEYSIKNQHEDWLTKVKFDEICIPRKYVLDGTKDVGLARLKDQRADNLPSLEVSVSGRDGELVGKTVVGHGRVFLRGSVLTDPNEERIMINTPFISGCSGCPLIGNNKDLVAFVHGGVKHRGGSILHNNNGTNNVYGYLYADILADVTFLPVDPVFYHLLRIAESIDDDLASRPTDAEAYKGAPENLRAEVKNAEEEGTEEAETLEAAMKVLCKKIWPNHQEVKGFTTTNPLTLHTRNHE